MDQHSFHCHICNKPSSLRCSRCLGTRYCSIACQRKDWTSHKTLCAEAEIFKNEFKGVSTAEDFDVQLKEQRALADAGDAQAQLTVGLAYGKGLGVRVDWVEAVKWFKKAAVGVSSAAAHANYLVGHAYQRGFGVSIDVNESFKFHKRGAELGFEEAQYQVGAVYFHGNVHVPVDKEESVKWLKLAAETGHVRAQFVLGNIYSKGDGAAINEMAGNFWYGLAAESGDADSQYFVGKAFRYGIAASDTQWWCPINEAMSTSWWKKSAAQGNSLAKFSLGMFLIIDGDELEGLKWLRQLVEAPIVNLSAGNPTIVCSLLSREFIASKRDVPSVQYIMGKFCFAGDGVQTYILEGIEWFRMSAEGGHPEAIEYMKNLAILEEQERLEKLTNLGSSDE